MVVITQQKLNRGRGSDVFLMEFRYLPSAHDHASNVTHTCATRIIVTGSESSRILSSSAGSNNRGLRAISAPSTTASVSSSSASLTWSPVRGRLLGRVPIYHIVPAINSPRARSSRRRGRNGMMME